MSKTRIIILSLRELIYTAIFVGIGILLLVILFFMFWPKRNTNNTTAEVTAANNQTSKYNAGVYTSQLSLGDATVNLQVTLDKEHVKSVELVHLDKSVATMYPLIKPAVKNISKQLSKNVSLDEVVLSDESEYTQKMVLDTISSILDKAAKK